MVALPTSPYRYVDDFYGPRPLRALHTALRGATLRTRCTAITNFLDDFVFLGGSCREMDTLNAVGAAFAFAFFGILVGTAITFLVLFFAYAIPYVVAERSGVEVWLTNPRDVATGITAGLRWLIELVVLAPMWGLTWLLTLLTMVAGHLFPILLALPLPAVAYLVHTSFPLSHALAGSILPVSFLPILRAAESLIPFYLVGVLFPSTPDYISLQLYLAGYVFLTSLCNFSLLHFLLGLVALADERLNVAVCTDKNWERQHLLARAEAAEEEVRRLRSGRAQSMV
ncbi:hypothetical protein JCM8097_003016 [Rhodosporidiobolus ruineniae]